MTMTHLSIGHDRHGSANPESRYKNIEQAMEDIKMLLVQLIEKIKPHNKDATNKNGPEKHWKKMVYLCHIHHSANIPMHIPGIYLSLVSYVVDSHICIFNCPCRGKFTKKVH